MFCVRQRFSQFSVVRIVFWLLATAFHGIVDCLRLLHRTCNSGTTTMMNYQQAAELLASARNKDNGKPLENNTRLIAMGNDFAVVLHSTAVVTIHADGTYTLRAGGWRTVT